jgi:hypothetical protein
MRPDIDRMRTELNPRVLLWLRERGLSKTILDRDAQGRLQRVFDESGVSLPWTIDFMLWVQNKWSDFAKYKHCLDIGEAIRDHGHASFDLWLARVVT